jgi:large repetitive protein
MKKFLPLVFLILLGSFQAKSKDLVPAPGLVADFTTEDDITVICAGGSIQFKDLTTEDPDGWTWTFEGGTPATSTTQHPLVQYTTPGTYKVSLKANNSKEGDEESKEEYIKVLAIPTATFTVSGQQCFNGNSFNFTHTGSGGTHQWTFNSGSPGASAAVNPSGISFTTPGSHIVTHKVTDDGCTGTFSSNVIVFPPITGVSATPTASNCAIANGTITVGTVTGGTSPFTYSLNGGTFGTSTFFQNLAPGTHTLIIKDAHNCTHTVQVTVQSAGGPTQVVSTVTNATCSVPSGSVTLGAVTGGVSPYQFSIDNGPFSSTVVYGSLTVGSHIVKVKDANGCVLSKTIVVSMSAGPQTFGTSKTTTACASPSGTITVTNTVGGVSPFTYAIDGGAFSSNNVFTGLAAGVHQVFLKDGNGCVISQQITITTAPSPTGIAVTVQPTSCQAATGSITLGAVSGGTAPYTFSVNGSAFTTAVNYPTLTAGVHAIVVKDANGCTFNTSATITGTQPADVNVTTIPSICSSPTGSITIGAVTGGQSPFTYAVNSNTFTSSTNYTNLAAGTYNVSVKDANGCILTKFVTITSSGPTDLAVTVTNTPCTASNGVITIGATTGGTSPFTYSVNGGTFTSAVSYPNLAAGGYTVAVKDANNCTFTKTVAVNTTSGPSAMSITATPETCGTNNGTITIGTVTGGSSPFLFSVDNSTFSTTVNYSNLNQGNHTVTAKDADGCQFTVNAVVENLSGPSAAAISTTKTTCGNANGTLIIAAISGGSSPFTYSLDGSLFTSTANYTGLAGGSHNVIIKDANGCTLNQTVIISAILSPTSLSMTIKAAGCFTPNDGNVVINGPNAGAAPFTFSFDGSPFTSNKVYTNLAAGTYNVTVKDANGCTFTTTAVVNSLPAGPSSPVIVHTPPTCGQADGALEVTGVTGGTAPLQYQLSGNGINTGFGPSTLFTGLTPSSYTISIKDANGCAKGFVQMLQSTGGPVGVASTHQNSTCNQANGSMTITNVGGGTGPFTFSVNGGTFTTATTYTGLAPAQYPLVIKDANNCTFNTAFLVQNTGIPPATPTISQQDFVLTSSSSTGNQWFLDGVAISGETGQNHTVLVNGTYTVVVTANGCASAISAPVVITNKAAQLYYDGTEDSFSGLTPADETSAENPAAKNQAAIIAQENADPMALTIYPNPSDGHVIISFFAADETSFRIEVVNSMGQVIFADQQSLPAGTYSRNLEFPMTGEGVYYVVLTTESNRTIEKMIVQ